MTRSAAAKTAEAADALRAWLDSQPPPMFRQRGLPGAVPAQQAAGATDPPEDGDAAGQPLAPATAHQSVAPRAITASAEPPVAAAVGAGNCHDAPLRLAHPDWLYHRLTITGPKAALAAFRAAAAGAGVIPWHLDLDRIAEDCFHLLAAPPPPHQRSLSLAGARVVAGQLRAAVARRHDLAVSRVGFSRACPFDLHTLVPVPAAILRRGPDDPVSLQWLWTHWGTTRELRHVVAATAAAATSRQGKPEAGLGETRISFWSADWSPWRALARIAAAFPALRFDLRPSDDPP
jgi:hypothetical protein